MFWNSKHLYNKGNSRFRNYRLKCERCGPKECKVNNVDLCQECYEELSLEDDDGIGDMMLR